MSVQEVMRLVEKNSILTAFCYFWLTFLVIALFRVLLSIGKISGIKGAGKLAMFSMTLFFLSLGVVFPREQVQSRIAKAVIVKKVTRHTTWYQDENGDYHFGKYRVAQEDVSVMKRHPKLSKPYAKVTTKYISNRFSKKQKAKIYRSLSPNVKDDLKSTAVIHK